jgi:cob(I)alamin adenosyltransferase
MPGTFPKKTMNQERKGLIQVYTGEGKGKTTAALGLALRAAGHGWHTYIGQFMKGQTYGELAAAQLLGQDAAGRSLVTIEQYGQPTFIHHATPQDMHMARQGLARAKEAMRSGEYEIVVLDEINVALYFELIDVEDVLDLIEQKPSALELVLTGRRVPQAILDRADYVTVMQEVKHPYAQGISARKGIEF